MNSRIIVLVLSAITFGHCNIEDEDVGATPDFSGIFICDIWIYQNDVAVASSSDHTTRVVKVNKDVYEIFPFHSIDDLEHISFYGEIQWDDPTTAGITPFNIWDKTIIPEVGNTIEIVVNDNGSVTYNPGDLPIFLTGIILAIDGGSINFSHNGGFKDIGGDLYATFKLAQGSEEYNIYLFSK